MDDGVTLEELDMSVPLVKMAVMEETNNVGTDLDIGQVLSSKMF